MTVTAGRHLLVSAPLPSVSVLPGLPLLAPGLNELFAAGFVPGLPCLGAPDFGLYVDD